MADKKEHRLEIRLSDMQLAQVERVAELLKCSKAEAVRKLVGLVDEAQYKVVPETIVIRVNDCEELTRTIMQQQKALESLVEHVNQAELDRKVISAADVNLLHRDLNKLQKAYKSVEENVIELNMAVHARERS